MKNSIPKKIHNDLKFSYNKTNPPFLLVFAFMTQLSKLQLSKKLKMSHNVLSYFSYSKLSLRLENAAPLWHLFNKLLFGGSNYYVWHVFWRMMMTPPTTLLACGGLTTKPVVVKNVVPFKKSLLKQLFQILNQVGNPQWR